MKKILNIFSLFLFLIVPFSANVFAQAPSQKLTAEEIKERSEVAAFVDSFMQEYYKTYELTKVPKSYFVSDYKKLNVHSFFIENFDAFLSDEEKFQNGFMNLDLFNLGFFVKIDEADYDLKKAFQIDDEGEATNSEIFGTKITAIFQKHPKSMVFLRKEELDKIKNVDDFRAAIKEFQNALQELREFVITNQIKKKDNVSEFRKVYKEKFFEFRESFDCSGDDCQSFPAQTKMFLYRAFLLDLVIVKDKGKLKIVRIYPISD